MRILYITQYYTTPDKPGSLRHYAHTQEWARKGHDVVVLTTFVLHKNTVIPSEYEGVKSVAETIGGCTVRKLYSRPSFSGFRGRMANYLTFMCRAMRAGLRERGPFDVVMASSPSLFAALAGSVVARAKRVPFVLEIRDLWPASAIATGHLTNPFIIWLARRLEASLYAHASAIVCVTERIADAVRAKASDSKSIFVIPNGVDAELFHGSDEDSSDVVATHLSQIEGSLALYAGSHGKNNALDTIIEAAKLLSDERVHFVLIGEGDQTERLRAWAKRDGLRNVTFLGSLPREHVPRLLRRASVLLWPVFWNRDDPSLRTLKEGVVPNKLYDYVASGRPLVTSVPRPSEASEKLEQWGAVVAYADPNTGSFARAIQAALAMTPMSEHDCASFIDGHSRARYATKVEQILRSVSEGRT